MSRVSKTSSTFVDLPEESESDVEVGQDGTESLASVNTVVSSARPRQSARADNLDRDFLSPAVSSSAFINGVASGVPGQLYPHQRQVGDDGARLSSRRLQELESLGALQAAATKKHYKGNKRQKARSGAGYG